MTRSEIYRRAAEWCIEGGCSCVAVKLFGGGPALRGEHVVAYAEMFKPDNCGDDMMWGWLFADNMDHRIIQKGRVLALCFAAAMAESGDL